MDGTLSLQRLTGDKKYTDKMKVVLASNGSSCDILGCSESQVTSVLDFGTNYCNLRMLYCGSKDGCKPVAHDFTSEETKVTTSAGATHVLSKCLTV